MAGEVERLRLIRKVTTDPAGYEAELRAKWEAEANGTAPAPRVSPAAKLPPSLANVRSALPRSSSAYTGPQSLDDILGQRATTPGIRLSAGVVRLVRPDTAPGCPSHRGRSCCD